jgi:hypothetical protein
MRDRPLARRIARTILVLTLAAMPAAAQETATVTPPTPPPAPTEPPAVGEEAFEVAAAYVVGRKGKEKKRPIGPGVLLAVELPDLASWVGAQKERCAEVRLTINRTVIESAAARCELETGRVVFNLDRVDRAREDAWGELLAIRDFLTVKADISLALGGDAPLPTAARDLELLLVYPFWGIVALIGLLAVAVGIFELGRRSGMLRNPGEGTNRPYSLARVQMAWWFFLILGGFLLITLLVGAPAAIPGSVLGLMGIASGTFLAAEVVDVNRDEARRQKARAAVSRDFVKDILSDDGGVTFHRFQTAVWTLALGIYFAVKVAMSLEMPVFDMTLLGLMGISNGTYLGMKIPEDPKPS